MATYEDLQRLALALPGVTMDGLELRLEGKLLAWPWRERVDPKKPRVVNPAVAVLRVVDEARKHELVAADPDIFFTEPHYDGYAAVLVRLEAISEERLALAVAEAWAARARRRRTRPAPHHGAS